MDQGQLITAVETKYKDVKTLEADFTQVAHDATFGDETVKGKVVVKRPGKMRWTFGTEKFFVTDGTKMWIYTVQDKQVIQYDDISKNSSSAESFLTSLDKIHEKFDVKVVKSDAAGHVVELTPKSTAEQFKKVRLELDGNLVPKQVTITDTFDHVTDIAFANVALNKPTDDALFTFVVPAGVDVVKAN
jgi:outer membrane lipoprotein carrier protein